MGLPGAARRRTKGGTKSADLSHDELSNTDYVNFDMQILGLREPNVGLEATSCLPCSNGRRSSSTSRSAPSGSRSTWLCRHCSPTSERSCG